MTLRDDQLPPPELWLGKVDGEWPIHVFTSEASVKQWLSGEADRPFRAWRVLEIKMGPELRLIAPEPYLQEVES